MNTNDDLPDENAPEENLNEAADPAADPEEGDAPTILQLGKAGEVTAVFLGPVGEVTQLGDVYGDLTIN